MPYFLVQDFKLGLDSRRNELTSPAGSLIKCKNAHISRGGEIEKRNCFEKLCDLSPYLHGFDVSGDGLFVFCDISEWPENSELTYLNSAGVSVIQIAHPRYDEGYASTEWEIDKVMWSTVFDGRLFSIVRFMSTSDNNVKETYCYYDERKEIHLDGAIRYYKPTIVSDIYAGLAGYGILNSSEVTTASVANELLERIKKDPNFSNSTLGTNANEIIIEGPSEKEFIVEANRLSDSINFTTCTQTSISKVNTREAVTASPVVKATAAFAIAGGSEGKAHFATYARNFESNLFLMKVTQINVDGVDIAAVNLNDPITYLDNDDTTLWHGEIMAGALANFVNANSGISGYTAVAKHSIDYQAWNGTGFTYFDMYSSSVNPTTFNGLEVWIELDNTFAEINLIGAYHRTASAFVDATTAVVSTISKIGAVATNSEGTLKMAKFGLTPTFSGGIDNSISSIMVDGQEILGGTVSWSSSNGGTMVAIADAINAYQSDYTAVVSENKVQITHNAGGSACNGKQLGITTNGNVVVNNLRNFSGGEDSLGALSQKTKITIGSSATELVGRGTRFEINTKIKDDVLYTTHCASDITGTSPVYASVYKSKMHLVAGATVFFSVLNEPMSWDPQRTGAGFVNFSNNFSSKYDVVTITPYRSSLAVFAPMNIQIWMWDPNPELNSQMQVLSNTGAVSVGSVVELGDIDVFYVSSSGIRSLKARDNTDSAQSSDTGTQIDTLIQAEIKDAGTDLNISSVIEPNSGRYMMAINDKIYVLSQFIGSQIQAWSTYEPGLGDIEKLSSSNNELYLKTGGSLYKLSKENYTSVDDQNQSEVIMPYLDGQKPAHTKTFSGIDATISGTWQVYAGTNTSNILAKELIATISSPTFQLGRIPMVGIGTHMGVSMISPASNYPSTIGNLMIHYKLDKAD